MLTENFQMFRLGLEKAEEAEIKLLPFTGAQRKQGNSRNNIHFCFTDHAKACDCVDHKKLWKIPFFPHHLWQTDGGKTETVTDLLSWVPKSLWTVTATMKLKGACPLKEKL